MIRGGWTPIKTTRLYVNSAVASVAEISATPTQQRAIDRLARRARQPLPDATNLYLGALPRGGGSYRSASAAARPDGSTVGWLQRWIAAALRRRSGFPRIAGPLVVGFPLIAGPPVLFQSGWEHDGFQWGPSRRPGASGGSSWPPQQRAFGAAPHRRTLEPKIRKSRVRISSVVSSSRDPKR